MQVLCADCGCRVDRGVVVDPCETPECCCLELPVRSQESPSADGEEAVSEPQ